LFLQASIIVGFGFLRRDIADGTEKAAVIEPVDPFKRRVFNRFE